MAQVRKYKSGGDTKAEGSLNYNGEKWSGKDFIDNFRQWGKNRYQNDYEKYKIFGKIVDAIEKGDNITFDSDNLLLNNLSDDKFELSDNNRVNKKLSKNPTWWEKNFPTNRDDYRAVIADLRNYSYVVPKETPKAKEKIDWSNSVTYYTTSDSEKYPIGTGKNNAAIKRLTDIITGRSEDNEYILYGNLDATTYDDAKNNGKHFNKYNNILKKLENSKLLTQQDIADLETFGIVVKDIAKKVDPDKGEEVEKPEQKKVASELKSLVDQGIVIGNDEDGYTVSEDVTKSYGNAAMFNDNWKNSKAHYASNLAPLYGYTLLNGQLYKTDTWNTPGTPLYQYIAQKGILDKIKEGKFEDANKELNYQWGHDDYKLQTYDPYTYFPGVGLTRKDEFLDWSKWDNTYRYTTGNAGDPDDVIFKYWYRDLYKENDPWSISFRYSSDIDPKYFVQAPIDYHNRIKAPNTHYDGKVAVRSADIDPAFTYYYDPTDPNSNMIFQFHRPELAKKLDNKAIIIPANIARQLLANNPDTGKSFMTTLNWPYQKAKEFANILMSKVKSGWSDLWYDVPEYDDYKNWGAADPYSLQLYMDQWIKRQGQSPDSRKNEYLIDPYQHPPMHKNGGVIQSFQSGGYIMPSLGVTVEEQPKQKDIADAIDPTVKFTKQDKWDIINLAADVASFAVSWFPGGSLWSAGIGALSTLSQTGANIARDGLDWGDIGNLVTGLGFDAVSLIPGAGIGSKIGKLTKMVTNIAPILSMGFGAMQLPQSAMAMNNIINGKSTIEDWRDLLYGLQALVGIGASKKMMKQTRVANPTTITELPNDASWWQRRQHSAQKSIASSHDRIKGLLMKNRELDIPEGVSGDDLKSWYNDQRRKNRTYMRAITEVSPHAAAQIEPDSYYYRSWNQKPSGWHMVYKSHKKGGVIKAKKGFEGFWKDIKDGIENMDFLNLSELGTTIAGNAMIANAQKKQVDAAWKSNLKTYAPKSTPIYNQSVLDAGYVDRKNQINNTTFTHSDPRYNLSFQSQKLTTRNDLDREYWNNVSRFNAEYNNKLIETNWQNRTLAQQIADNNRSAFYQGQAAMHEVDAQHWNNQFKTAANYFTQLRQDRDKKLAYDRDLYTKMYTTQYQQRLNDAQTALNRVWTDASNANNKLTYTNWITGAGKSAYDNYQSTITNISNNYYTNLGSLTNKRKLWRDPTLTK